MLSVCPRCRGTVFDPAGPTDRACRGCGAVLPGFEFVELTRARTESRFAEPKAGRRVSWAAVALGLALIGGGVGAAVTAGQRFARVKTARATVTVTKTVHDRQKVGETFTHIYVREQYTEDRTATYVVNGVRYHTAAPAGSANGHLFDIYYDPTHPAGGSRLPPIGGFVLAALLGLAGLGVAFVGGVLGSQLPTPEPPARLPTARRLRPADPDSSPATTTA